MAFWHNVTLLTKQEGHMSSITIYKNAAPSSDLDTYITHYYDLLLREEEAPLSQMEAQELEVLSNLTH